jgi:hypothetical protein
MPNQLNHRLPVSYNLYEEMQLARAPSLQQVAVKARQVEQDTLCAMKRLVEFRDVQITHLTTALATASQQNDLANRRILALEVELEIRRQQVGNMEAQLLLVAEAEDKDGGQAIERVLKDLSEQTVSRPNRQRLREGLDRVDAGDALRRAIGSG